VLTLSLPLAALWGRYVGAVPFPVPAPSLGPAEPTCQSSPTSRPRSPTVDAPTSAHSPATSSRPTPLLSPVPCSPTSPRSFAPSADPLALSLALRARPENSATAHHWSLSVLRSPSHPCPVLCLGEFRLTVSYKGHPSVCPPLLWFAWSALTGVVLAQPKPRLRRPEVPPHLRHPPRALEFALEVSNLPAPLIRPLLPFYPRDCSPELIGAAVSPPRRVQRPLVLLRQRDAHGRVRQTALHAPELFLKPLEPRRGQSPCLQRALAAGTSGATAFRSAPQPLDLGRPFEIERFRFHQCGSDHSPPIWIRPPPLPLTCAPAPGLGWSARPGSLTPRPRLSVASSRPRAPARSNPVR
jgi:hypothetical protein